MVARRYYFDKMEQKEEHLRNIRQLIENKDHDGLEKYITDNQSSWHRHYFNDENAPIALAIKNRDEKAINLLINHKLDDLSYHLDTLQKSDRLYLAQCYNDNNDPDNKRSFIAKSGILTGSLEEIKFWHERGYLPTNIRSFDLHLSDPLFYCCQSGYNDCVEYLVTKAGCDVNREAKYGMRHYATPLKTSLLFGHVATADLLVKLGANVHQLISEQIHETIHTTIPISLIHHLCEPTHRHNEYQNRVAGMKWALEQGIDYDANCPVSDDYSESNLAQAPALVFACRSRSYELAELLLNHQREKYVNNGGPILESIACIKSQRSDLDRLTKLVQLILPMVDPHKKEEQLANALAAAIYHLDYEYEQLLKELGADIRFFTKKVKYCVSKCRHFHARMKLLRDGVDFLTEQNETKSYQIARVDIPTRTAKLDSIRKKMKSISHSDEIYFEMQAKQSDPEYENIWKHIHFNSDQHWKRPLATKILLLDQKTNKIYKGIPEIEKLVLNKIFDPPREYACIDFSDSDNFFNKYAVFALTIPEDEANLILPKGYRIMYKQNSNEAEQSDPTETYTFGAIKNRQLLNSNNNRNERDTEQEDDANKNGRSTRAAKRKLDEQSVIEEQPVETKRRKTRK